MSFVLSRNAIRRSIVSRRCCERCSWSPFIFPFSGHIRRVATHRGLFDSVGAGEDFPRLDAKQVYHKIFPSCLIF